MDLTLAQRLEKHILTGKVSNDDMVQIIEVCCTYLNPMSISDYAKEKGISYNGAKHFRPHILIAGKKFIIDND